MTQRFVFVFCFAGAPSTYTHRISIVWPLHSIPLSENLIFREIHNSNYRLFEFQRKNKNETEQKKYLVMVLHIAHTDTLAVFFSFLAMAFIQ